MSTTLTNGLKLPDKGSVDWYADMQSNYAILDGAVGTVAEHTTQIAGKAPAVHTHTKSDITDFPAYGNAAGTICEGNDSRLSDARTPVAHTHTKSDVTDLLNSNFIPSANNSYDLGSFSYQWNNLYAKNYYYNGTAWGLDKANVWSQSQTISANTNKAYIVANTSYTLGEETPSTTKELGGVFFKDSNSNNAAYLNVCHEKTTGDIYTRILTRFKFDNGVKSTTGSAVTAALDIGLTNSAEKFVRPSANNEVNLGTSTNKWTSLNGINPGALSLPDNSVYYSFNTDNFVYTGAYNEVTVPKKGWLYLRLVECNQDAYIACSSSTGNVDYPVFSIGTMLNRNTGKYEVNFLMPLSVTTFRVYIYKTQGTLTQHKVFYTEGMIQ